VPGIARHGRLKKAGPMRAVLTFIAAAVAVVLVAGVGVTAVVFYQLTGAITYVPIHSGAAATPAPPPGIGVYPGGFNVLIVGDDTRDGQGGIGAGADDGGALNDVTMLLHVSGDHTNATAVSIPRDMVVPIAACSKGGPAAALPINTALSFGGLECVVATVEGLTGLKIQFAGLITFRGVIEMSDAVGGVQVCVSGNINDREVGLHLKAGYHTLEGITALKFLRSRHGVGDGSDLGRISSQQVYLSSLVRKLESSNTLTNPATLFKIASAATRNMALSDRSIDTWVSIAQALKDIPLNRVQFVQYPGTTGVGGVYQGKVAPIQSEADALFALIKADKPFTLAATDLNRGSVKDPNKHSSTPTSTATPSKNVTVLNGIVGQSAAQYTCSKANKY
jgi:LCP family protein required for cell wall assembly